jgi:hypothetical protein
MFVMEDEYILASFLHPKFKRPLSATPAQKKTECYGACRVWLPKGFTTTTTSTTTKEAKTFLRTINER